ncbi:MAG: sulfatase-like hydrolase/transferase [Chloroflexi bacterium]|nr:sulfatase-like hydrolase/transferase [Chloroflexota bacterium]
MPDRPNILFILPDQLRPDYLSCYGAQFIRTPHIDSLAAEGTLYGRCYSGSPVCVPARVSLMTGMNAIKTGVLDNSHFLPPDYAASGLRTWPEMLFAAGYHTAAIGKMHFYPWEAPLGFQERIIAEDKIWIRIQDDYARRLAEHGYAKTVGNDKPEYHANHGAFISDIPWDLSVDRFVGQETCRYLREYDREEPFALMVGFPGPHNPYDPTPEFARLFDPEDMPAPIPEGQDPLRLGGGGGRRSWYAIENAAFTERHMRVMRAYYAALVAQIDHEVGDILSTLRERGMLENTVVIFSSDHGDYLGDHGLTGKNSFFEPATRVPLLVRAPGAEGGRFEGLVELTDVTATILGHAQVPLPGYYDSAPLPAAGLEAAGEGREYVFGALASGWMVVDGEWKLCKYANGQTMLFHLPSDPQEQHNLYADPAAAEAFGRLDEVLTRELVRSVRAAAHERRVMAGSLSNSDDFGRVGWCRPYPGHVEK